MHWHLSYFNYWLTHCFYFTAGLIIVLAIGSNKWEKYRRKLKLLKRLEKYSKPYLPVKEDDLWLLNQ